MQWVCGYLTDEDFKLFLSRARKSLKKSGVVILKENNGLEKDGFMYEPNDANISRTNSHFKRLFAESNWEVISIRIQKFKNQSMLPVRLYAIQPSREAEISEEEKSNKKPKISPSD
jgi:protein N-terminal methyltransferase